MKSASYKIRSVRQWLRTHLMVVLLLSAGAAGTIIFAPHVVSSQSIAPPPVQPAHMAANKSAGPISQHAAYPHSLPTRLIIPKIGVNAPITQLGLNSDGTLATPYSPTQVGWYKGSPTPGETGPSIIDGHVDYINYGPAVFWNLSKLSPGDTFEVDRTDGTAVKFKVDSVRQVTQNNFPTQDVYGNINYPGIRLITCGGTWNAATHHYSDNTVVFGSLL